MTTSTNQKLKQLWSNPNSLRSDRNLSIRFTINTLGNSKPNWSWQNLTMTTMLCGKTKAIIYFKSI